MMSDLNASVPDLATEDLVGTTVVRAALNRRSQLFFWIWIAAIAVVGFALRTLIPMNIGWRLPHDDLSSAQIVAALRNGQWLGTWDTQAIGHTLLSKAPGYPIFVAYTSWTGLNPAQLSYLLYLVGGVLIAAWFRHVLGNHAGVVLFLVLAFSPVMVNAQMSRAYRDPLVAALALLALGAALQLFLVIERRVLLGMGAGSRWWSVKMLALAALLGGCFGWLRITRGDTLWVVSSVVFLGIWSCVRVLIGLRNAPGKRTWRNVPNLLVGIGSILILVALVVAPGAWIKHRNSEEYGVPLGEDYSAGAFGSALRTWASLPGAADGEVVSTAQRQLAYEYSPTARSIQEAIEDSSNGWRTQQCGAEGRPAEECEAFESYGGYLSWALRDAAMQDAGVSSPAEFQQFFGTLDRELTSICDLEEVECGSRGLSPDVGQLSRVSTRVLVDRLAGFITGSIFSGSPTWSPEPFGQLPPSDLPPAYVQTWVTSVNGAAEVLDTSTSSVGLGQMSLPTLRELIRHVYGFFALPALVLTMVLVFRRRFWASPIGAVALAAGAGWMMNLGIVAVFRAATLRGPGRLMEMYTMPSESYFLVAVTAGVLYAVHTWWPTMRGAAPRHKAVNKEVPTAIM